MYDYRFGNMALTTWVLLRQTWLAMYKASRGRVAKVGLTAEQFDVLWICKDHRGPLSSAELSRLIFREAQTTTGMLNRMEREGLVKRVPKRKGKPFTEVQITAKGREAVRPGLEVFKVLVTAIMSRLSPEEHEQLQKLLRVIQQTVAEELRLDITPPAGYSADEVIPIEW